MQYYEDIEVGDVTECGSRTVTKAEIIDFATQYDPQSFHVDEEAAADSPYGGLIASGWHTAALCMRQLVDGVLGEQAGMGALGVDELRWYRPVQPGDTISVTSEVLEKRPSESDASRGHVTSKLTGYNQDGDEVISWVGLGLVKRREGEQ
ncbi:MaoC family dehydratase [Halomarina ordinaria]|uniref:MaoC family dehydratase n=1 Tax=Halomarina ordinaria TaxID=3033939 RepID=A0ABD5UGK4_9EURY|nr:MaoC family dehydratase [Halomarina sp. PSRA2]